MNQLMNIPEELKQLPQWVCRKKKIPFNPVTGAPAKAGQPKMYTMLLKLQSSLGRTTKSFMVMRDIWDWTNGLRLLRTYKSRKLITA